jgi:hypothetical protein
VLVGDHLVHVLLVPVLVSAIVVSGRPVTLARSSSVIVAVTIGSSCEKSTVLLGISAASTICP